MTHRLVYDGECGFCRWSLAWVLRWDRRRALEPVALQDPRAATLLPDLSVEERAASWHLVGPDGRVASGGDAAAPLLRVLPGGGPPAALAERFPGAVERAYGWVNRHRGTLARGLTPGAVERGERVIARRTPQAPR